MPNKVLGSKKSNGGLRKKKKKLLPHAYSIQSQPHWTQMGHVLVSKLGQKSLQFGDFADRHNGHKAICTTSMILRA